MKAWTVLIIIVVACISCRVGEQEKFQINGFVEGATDRFILVKKFDGEGYQLVDSIRVRNGEFSYSGKLKYPELYRFYLSNSEQYFPIFIENKRIYINTSVRDFRKANISGSASHALYETFVRHIDSMNRAATPLLTALRSKKKINESERDMLKKRLDSLSNVQIDYVKSFVLGHPQSVVSLYILYKYLSNELSVDEFEQIYRQMDTSLYESQYADYIEHQIDILKHTRVGQKAYNFVLPDTTGTSIALQSIHNRYVLIQFWASWCDACREEMPEIVKLYNQHKKHLTIVSISLDTNYKRWTDAIELYGMKWQHLSDLMGWKNKTASIFGVRSIPYYLLLDESHTILYKGSRLDEVKKLMDSGM